MLFANTSIKQILNHLSLLEQIHLVDMLHHNQTLASSSIDTFCVFYFSLYIFLISIFKLWTQLFVVLLIIGHIIPSLSS